MSEINCVLKKIFHKSRIYPLVLMLVVFVVWKYRQTNNLEMVSFQGTTMGTIQYTVKYLSSSGHNYKAQVDSLLEVFNKSLNHYRPDSELSKFNKDSSFVFESPFFYQVLAKSKEINQITSGAFDPTIGPLINAWGFGPAEKEIPDSSMVDSLLRMVHFENLEFDSLKVWKKNKDLQLDFSAIAKGQGVDVVTDFLLEEGLDNVFVEIGGEVRCHGTNENGGPWKIGIIDPVHTGSIYGSVALTNRAIATSGNYYNFIEEEGQRIVHTLNPVSGYPVSSNLLSATVVAEDCMTADAYATAFMVLGFDQAKELLVKFDELEGVLIYSKADGSLGHYMSEGLKSDFLKFDNTADDH